MTDNRNADLATASLTRRGFLGAAAAATVAFNLEPQEAPTSPLLDPRLQSLVGRQRDGFDIDSRTSTMHRFVLQHSQKTLRHCEVNVQALAAGCEVTVLGESGVLAKALPGFGFGLQASGLAGMDLDRYGYLATMPEQVLQTCARLFDVLPSEARGVARSPAVIDWSMVRILETVVERFPELDVSGSGPFGRLGIVLADGGLCVERVTSRDPMTLRIWVDEWRGLLLPQFEGFRGLRRYVDAVLGNLSGISVAPTAELNGTLANPWALLPLIDAILNVAPITITVASRIERAYCA